MGLDLGTKTIGLALSDVERRLASPLETIKRIIAQFPRMIEAAAAAHEPHRVAFYLHELSSAFHSHWNRGKDYPQLRFVNANERELTCARVALVVCLTIVLGSGLSLLGVSAPDEMR